MFEGGTAIRIDNDDDDDEDDDNDNDDGEDDNNYGNESPPWPRVSS